MSLATTVGASPRTDPSYDVLGSRQQPLDAIFAPRNVAVIGATDREGAVGRTLLWNLVSNPFGGTVFPVNPKRDSVLGIQAYPSVGEIPAEVDLAVIATPAPTVPGVIAECVEAGVQGAIIISAGFKEIGEEGRRLEKQIKEEARRGAMRIVGPNCLGVMRPSRGLNATFAGTMARPGSVAFVSQSGALLTSILDWSFREHVGFSAFVSVGSMLDVGWGDLIDYLGNDPRTESIVLYMESIGEAQSFLSAAREVALSKPIIVIKAGRTEEAAQAAASHTGSLAGSDAVLDAAFRRTGVLRVKTIADLFYMAEVLSKQPRPRGPRLTVLTNAGGPGVLATDALVEGGGELAELSDETESTYNAFLPDNWSHGNPVDVLGDADPERYRRAVEVAAEDPDSDGLLVVLTPQAMTSPTQTAEHLKDYAQLEEKPVLASWMGGSEVAAGERILNQAGIPTFSYPDTAARVFNYMWQYSYNLRGIYETPSLPHGGEAAVARERVHDLLDKARSDGRSLLTEHASKEVLDAYNIPTVDTRVAASGDEAVDAAEDLGYPVVLKLHSHTLTHKTDVGGVQLDLEDADDVRRAFDRIREGAERAHEGAFDGVTVQPMIRMDGYELIVGCSQDAQFGPVLLFGSGGQLVEVYRDRALGLPPLNTTLARRMMQQTRVYEALKGVRGRGSVDFEALESLLVRFSQLVVEQDAIKEIDINPLLAAEDGIVALDARILLFDEEEERRTPVIRPYPHQYAGTWTTAEGAEVNVRPIRPEDEPKMVRFHEMLSERSVYMRYASMMKTSQRVAHDRLVRICFNDYDREMALVAEVPDDEAPEGRQIVGVGRLTKLVGTNDAEFALVVADAYQRQGIGTELLRRLLEVAQAEELDRVMADILQQNYGMQRLVKSLGFNVLRHDHLEEEMVKAVKVL